MQNKDPVLTTEEQSRLKIIAKNAMQRFSAYAENNHGALSKEATNIVANIKLDLKTMNEIPGRLIKTIQNAYKQIGINPDVQTLKSVLADYSTLKEYAGKLNTNKMSVSLSPTPKSTTTPLAYAKSFLSWLHSNAPERANTQNKAPTPIAMSPNSIQELEKVAAKIIRVYSASQMTLPRGEKRDELGDIIKKIQNSLDTVNENPEKLIKTIREELDHVKLPATNDVQVTHALGSINKELKAIEKRDSTEPSVTQQNTPRTPR